MRKRFFILKSIAGFFLCLLFIGCEEGASEPILSIPIESVSKFSRDSVITLMTYKDKEVYEYNYFIRDSLVSKSTVNYAPSGLSCKVDSVSYIIDLDRGLRATLVEASVDGALLYRVGYTYNNNGFLEMAQLELPGVYETPIFIKYEYKESSIYIDEWGDKYELNLSSEENTGNVCSVLSFSNAPLTTNYIINPDLYFLNIYGVSIKKLPFGQTIRRKNNQITRIGKFYYEY